MIKKIAIIVLTVILFQFQYGEVEANETTPTASFSSETIHSGGEVSLNLSGTFGGQIQFDNLTNYSGYTYEFISINDFIYSFDSNNIYTIKSEMDLKFYLSNNVVSFGGIDIDHVVVFASPAGYIYDYVYVEDGETVASIDIPSTSDLKEIPNMTLASEAERFKNEDGSIKHTDSINSSVIFYTQYVTDTASVTVTTPELTTIENMSNPDALINFNDVIKITAPNTSGTDTFSHFVNSSGEILSYDNPYTTTATYSTSITPVYVETPDRDQNHLSISTVVTTTNYYSYAAQLELKSGHTLIEYGFLYDNDNTFEYNDGDAVISLNQNRTYHGAFSKAFLKTTTNLSYVRAYMITKDGDGNFHYTYSVIRTVPSS